MQYYVMLCFVMVCYRMLCYQFFFSRSSNLDLELQSISALKSQYEESVRQNDTLQHLLEGEIKSLRESTLKSSSSLPSPQSEIHNLKRKLEESENWNRSLQSRLDQLLPRAGGVGASIDSADGSNSAQIDNIEFEKLQKVSSELFTS